MPQPLYPPSLSDQRKAANSPEAENGILDAKLCQVGGLNQNYVSSSGTSYHIQVEDRGPILDQISDASVRRINLIIYANYGEANARIIYGRDHDYEDVRTQKHNRVVQARIQEILQEARTLIEEKEQRLVMRIKAAIREYYYTKSDSAKQEFEEANSLFPFLFSRAWTELKKERESRPEVPATAPPVLAPLAPVVVESEVDAEMESFDIIYPLDPDLRERVIEIERVIGGLSDGIRILKAKGTADDILLQTCRKLVQRAKQTLERGEPSDFTTRRLDLTRQSLITTWKQVQSRLRSSQSLPR